MMERSFIGCRRICPRDHHVGRISLATAPHLDVSRSHDKCPSCLALIACAGVASAAPQQRIKPRGTFATFIDPAAFAARPPRSPPSILSVELVLECGRSASSQAMRERLARELGREVAGSITISIVSDCASDAQECVQVGCECFPIEAAWHDCRPLGVDVANAAKLVFDFRCTPGSIRDIAAAIRSRLARHR